MRRSVSRVGVATTVTVLAATTVLAVSGCAPASSGGRPAGTQGSAMGATGRGTETSDPSGGSRSSGSGAVGTADPAAGAGHAGTGVLPDAAAMTDPTTRTGRRVRVVGTLPVARLEEVAALGDAAVTAVERAWPRRWRGRIEVLAPRTSDEYRRVLHLTAPESVDVAAATDGPLDADGLARRDRIVLNPTGYGDLTREGRRFVLTHEVIHVALRSSVVGSAPTWLTEGFADRVAYAGVRRARTALAAPLLERVAADGPPATLPAATAYASTSADLATTYLQSWTAVEEVAVIGGRAAPARLVVACSTRAGEAAAERVCARAMPRVLGVDRSELVRRWRASLLRLAARHSDPGG